MSVRVVSARESAALDAEAISGGVPSRALMRVASSNAATVIAQRCGDRLKRGVTIYVGPGNNGGDGWCVGRALAISGIPVTMVVVAEPATPDAQAERDAAQDVVTFSMMVPPPGTVVIDALLGTGATGAPRDKIAAAVESIRLRRERGDFIIALDIPTGLDATTGTDHGSVVADITVTFGSCKRGLLVNRALCGEIVVVDIGLDYTAGSSAPALINAAWVECRLPGIAPDSNKGTRKKLTVVAGAQGMGGSAIIAATAALKSGIGMVRVVTHPDNIPAVHARLPEALTHPFPQGDDELDEVIKWGDGLLIGPGLGHDSQARGLVERFLSNSDQPLVLDADGLNVFSRDLDRLGSFLRRRPSVITPHPMEFSRLIGADVTAVLEGRYDIAGDVASAINATVLLKGTPTVITSPDGTRVVSAAGTAALATGGSGDMLGGMIATLLVQASAPLGAAGCAAWVHGRAAELCRGVRGVTLDDVLDNLPLAWQSVTERRASVRVSSADPLSSSIADFSASLRPAYPVLAQLPNLL